MRAYSCDRTLQESGAPCPFTTKYPHNLIRHIGTQHKESSTEPEETSGDMETDMSEDNVVDFDDFSTA